jgi:hypothetical protein
MLNVVAVLLFLTMMVASILQSNMKLLVATPLQSQ